MTTVATTTGRTPDPVDLHVGREIAARRQLQGFTQSDLAKALGLTFQQVQKYEKGSNRVSASKLHRIAAFLGNSPGSFFPPRRRSEPERGDLRRREAGARYPERRGPQPRPGFPLPRPRAARDRPSGRPRHDA